MKEVIRSGGAPAPIGPYSQAIASGDLLFCSGAVGLDPATEVLVIGDVAPQTRQALTNLAAILEAGGSSLREVIKTTVYLIDMADFAAFNVAYGESFASDPPARTTIAVKALPLGARVEIDAIARRRPSG